MPEASEWEGEDLEEEEEEEDTHSETEVPLYRTQTPEELTEEQMIQEEMDDESEAGTLHLEDLEDIVAEVDLITQDLLGEFPEAAFAFEFEDEEIDITIDEATDDVMLAGVGDHFHQGVDDVIAGELADPELTGDLPEDVVILKLDEDQVDVLVYDEESTDSVSTAESQDPTQQLALEVKEEQEELEKITESKSVLEVLESAGKPVLDAELEQEEVAAQDQYLEELEDVFARILEEIKVGLEEEDLTIEISVEPTSEQQDHEEISLQDEKDSVQEEVSDAASLAAQDSDTIDQVELGFSEYELFQLERQYLAERLTTKEEIEKIEGERITDQNASIEEEHSGQGEGMVPSSETETDSWGDQNQELNPEILDETLTGIEARLEALTDHSEQRAPSFEDNIDPFSSDISTSDSFTIDVPNDAENQTIDAEPTLGYSSLASLTGLPLWEQYVQNLRDSYLVEGVRPQIEEETLAQLETEANQGLKAHEKTLQFQYQGPTIPEPPPYDFLAELEAWEEEEEAPQVRYFEGSPISRFVNISVNNVFIRKIDGSQEPSSSEAGSERTLERLIAEIGGNSLFAAKKRYTFLEVLEKCTKNPDEFGLCIVKEDSMDDRIVKLVPKSPTEAFFRDFKKQLGFAQGAINIRQNRLAKTGYYWEFRGDRELWKGLGKALALKLTSEPSLLFDTNALVHEKTLLKQYLVIVTSKKEYTLSLTVLKSGLRRGKHYRGIPQKIFERTWADIRRFFERFRVEKNLWIGGQKNAISKHQLGSDLSDLVYAALSRNKLSNDQIHKILNSKKVTKEQILKNKAGKPLNQTEILKNAGIIGEFKLKVYENPGSKVDLENELLQAIEKFEFDLRLLVITKSGLLDWLRIPSSKSTEFRFEVCKYDSPSRFPLTELEGSALLRPDILIKDEEGETLAVIQLKGKSSTNRTKGDSMSQIYELIHLHHYTGIPVAFIEVGCDFSVKGNSIIYSEVLYKWATLPYSMKPGNSVSLNKSEDLKDLINNLNPMLPKAAGADYWGQRLRDISSSSELSESLLKQYYSEFRTFFRSLEDQYVTDSPIPEENVKRYWNSFISKLNYNKLNERLSKGQLINQEIYYKSRYVWSEELKRFFKLSKEKWKE